MIDIHCHILPGLDDGPKTMQKAVEMAILAKQSGTERMIATPHFCNGVYETPWKAVHDGLALFSREMEKQGVGLKIFAGAEIRLSHDTCISLEKGLLPSLAGSDYYLFELPGIFIRDGILKVLRQFRDLGIIPVIAHPEKNHTLLSRPDLIRDLSFENALFQVTGASVLGKNGKQCKSFAKEMIQIGQAHFIASDGHDTDFRTPVMKGLFQAVKSISNEKKARQILIENPEMILDQASNGNFMGKRVG